MKQKIYRLEGSTIRDIVLERLEELGASKYHLAHYGGMEVYPSTTFRYLSGQNRTTSSETIEQILAACGLAIVALDERPEWAQFEEAS